ncbi:MAG: DUF4124 domain-containing protein [Methylovulum miyakonense]|uniref:DUF4124 domain-containing protein n=1 Tax=Methylovulum miyakonense TaxID=645578 RepID=UPI003BB49D9C
MNNKSLLIGFLVISMTTMAATIYKWVDEDGRIQYGNKPPAEGKVESLAIDADHPRLRSLDGQVVDGEYRTWDGTVRFKFPYLLQPGAKIEAREISPKRSGLFMSDDLGNVYIVFITVNPKPKLVIDDIIKNFQPSYELLARKTVNTVRGKELRISSLRKGGSLITSQSIKGGKKMEKQPLNLIDTTTIFLAGKDNDIFEVTVGKTLLPFSTRMTPEEEQKHLTTLTEEYLENFLTGITIK